MAELVGFIAIVVSALIYQQTNRKSLLTFKAVADILWTLHYLALSAYTGAAVTLIACVREMVFFKSSSKSRKGKWLLLGFACITIVCTVLTWKNIFSLVAMIGSLISIISFGIGEPKLSRIMAFPISICMLIYGVSNGSWPVFITETLIMVSSVFGMFRYDLKDKIVAEQKEW